MALDIERIIERSKRAAEEFKTLNQVQTDGIVEAVCRTGTALFSRCFIWPHSEAALYNYFTPWARQYRLPAQAACIVLIYNKIARRFQCARWHAICGYRYNYGHNQTTI